MATSRAITAAGLAIALLTAVSQPARAQFGVFRNLGHTPQAQTQGEYDSYLEVVAVESPEKTIAKAGEFEKAFPESELLGQVLQYSMTAYRDLGDFEGVLRTGRRVLPLLPDNLETLATLAAAIPNRTAGRDDAAELIAEAEGYATRALETIARTQIPRAIPYHQWEAYREELKSRAHEALGHVAAKRGDAETAFKEFHTAVSLNPKPSGAQLFRLGMACVWTAKTEEAKKNLSLAAELGPGQIRKLALQELRRLKKRESK
jgi:tetratricopeptide (TPR) repeat protein